MKGLGKYIKARRTEKGLSFEDIERETNIMTVFLDAIERDDTALFINQDNYDSILSFYMKYLGLDKKAMTAQLKVLKLHEQRGTSLIIEAQATMKELIPALKLIKERQRISMDILEIHFGSYSKAKELFEYLEKNGFVAKPAGAYNWIINNEKINEYLNSK